MTKTITERLSEVSEARATRDHERDQAQRTQRLTAAGAALFRAEQRLARSK